MHEHPWIGLDVGTRRIGIALSDALGMTAQPYSRLDRQGDTHDVTTLAKLASQMQAQGFVIGLPRRTGGEAGPEVAAVQAFAAKLAEATQLPIEWFDERFTTVMAERALRAQGVKGTAQRERVDQVAAAIMLQDFLDNRRRQHGG